MGLASDVEAARLSSSDAEETLPLYEDSQRDAFTSDLPLPESKATPEDVRDFIYAVMRARGLDNDHARRIAARWQLGTGTELRQYPVAMYKEIFGAEDGWVVYKEVRVPYYTKEQKKSKWTRRASAICFIIAIMLIAASITVGCTSNSDAWQVASFFGGMLGGVTALASSVFMCVKISPERQAEMELMSSSWQQAPLPRA